MCGLILEFQKICVFWAKIWHWHKTRRSFGKVCPLGCSGKVRACQIQGGKRSHFHVNNSLLLLPFLLFLMLHEDQFCGFVELTCVTRTSKNAVSPRDQKRRLKNNWWRVTRLDLGSSTSDWLCRERRLPQPIGSTIQIWEVTCNQYGILAVVSQTSFRWRREMSAFSSG